MGDRHKLKTVAIIPARLGSTRFPGKVLADKTGRPLIQHVIEAVSSAHRVDQIVVATDDQRIADAVASCSCQAVLTRQDHPNGTSRIAEAVVSLPSPQPDLLVNVQADEPEIDPRTIDALIEALAEQPTISMATVASAFEADEQVDDPNIVKVVVDAMNRAMYFSRSVIPHRRDQDVVTHLKHLGLYAYRREFLPKYVALAPTPLEQAEKLEQLRALEHGYPILVVRVTAKHHGIDTPQQYEAFVKRYRALGGTP